MATITWVGGDAAGVMDSSIAANWSAGVPGSGDEVVIPNTTNECQLATSYTWGSLEIETGAEIDGNGKTIYLDDGGVAAVFSNLGTITGILDITCNGATGRNIYEAGAGNIRHLEIDRADTTFTLTFHLTLDGNLTITDGTLDTGADYSITASSGQIFGSADGTLDMNSSTITVMNGGDVQCLITGAAPTIESSSGAPNLVGFYGAVTFTGAATISCGQVGGAWTPGTSTVTFSTRSKKSTFTGTLYNLIINGSGLEYTINQDVTITNNLTITAGTFDTSDGAGTDYDLTVSGTLKMDDGIINCNGSTVLLGQGSLSGLTYGLHLTGGTFNGGTGTHTISVLYQTGGTCNLTSATTEMNGYNTSGGYSMKKEGGTFVQTAGTVNMTHTSVQVIQLTTSPTFYNLTFTAATTTSIYNWDATRTLTVSGDLNIEAVDTYNTQYTTLAVNNLIVVGDVILNGTLEAYESSDDTVSDVVTLQFGGLKINSGGLYSASTGTTEITSSLTGSSYRVNTGSTPARITHHNGLFLFTGAVTGNVYIDCGTSTATQGMYDVTVGDGTTTYTDAMFLDSAKVWNDLILNGNTASPSATSVIMRTGGVEIGGDLTITNASFLQYSTSAYALTVGGNVTLNADGVLNLSNGGTQSFNSLTINTNGEYIATSGLTTITGEDAGGSYALDNNGTFTHSDGEVMFTHAGSTIVEGCDGSHPFYDLTVNYVACDLYLYGAMVVDNDFKIKHGDIVFDGNQGAITVTGAFEVGENGTARFGYAGFLTSQALSFGSVNIYTNGTFNASSTDTIVYGNILNSGSFVHNDGNLESKFSTTIETGRYKELKGFSGSSSLYDFDVNATDGERTVNFITDIDVDRKITGQGSYPGVNFNIDAVTLTVGTTSATGSVGGKYIYGTDTQTHTIQAASELYPVDISTDQPLIFGTSELNIKWVNVTEDGTTQGNDATTTLTGDCEFDSFTLSDGDKLDLNGKRMECSGDLALLNGSIIDYDGMIVFTGSGYIDDDAGTVTNGASCNILQNGTSTSNIDFDETVGTFLYNQPSVTGGTSDGRLAATNTIIGAGVLSYTGDENPSTTDITIATGGTWVNSHTDSTVSLSGDFNMAGGLIGLSCYSTATQGEQGFVSPTLGSSYRGSDTEGTVECWFRTSDASGVHMLFTAADTDANHYAALYHIGGIIYFEMIGDTIAADLGTSFTANGQWHHVAVTYDDTDALMYVDGKVVATAAFTKWFNDTSDIDNVGIGLIRYDGGTATGFMMKGEIDEVRVWNTARTASDILSNMLSEVAVDATGLVNYWQLDEGWGDTAYDSCTNTTDIDLVSYDDGTDGWAGMGTYTAGTSTLKFNKAGTQYLYYNTPAGNAYVAGLHVANGSTTIINDIDNNEHPLYVSGSLTVSGTLDNTSAEYLRFGDNFITNSSVFDVANGTISGISSFVDDAGGTITLPEGTYPPWTVYYGKLSLSSDVTFNGGVKLFGQGSGDPELIFNGYTATVKEYVSLRTDAILNIGSGTLHYDHTGGSGIITAGYIGQTLNAGPGALIKGHSSASKTKFQSMPNFAVVGTCENLRVEENELKVTGRVINCTGDIIQQHPSIDADQQLDYDTADDGDVLIGRDLDKNTELVT